MIREFEVFLSDFRLERKWEKKTVLTSNKNLAIPTIKLFIVFLPVRKNHSSILILTPEQTITNTIIKNVISFFRKLPHCQG